MNRKEIEATSKQIVEYLSQRPEQEDTFGGIASWWVRSNRGEHGIDELVYILGLLLEKGEIEDISYKRDIVIYKIKKATAL
jgi:hypothetical protein